jgi:ribosome-binding protein aMBF1 (putative translation factor)
MTIKKNSYERFREKQLKDPEIKLAYEEEKFRAEIAKNIAREREKQDLTQRDLARKAHMQQSVIARLENVDYQNCTVRTIHKVARALGKKIQFVMK